MNNSSLTWIIIESLFELSWVNFGAPCQLKLTCGGLQLGMRNYKPWEIFHGGGWGRGIFLFFFFRFIFFIFKLYIIVLVLPNIKMNPPQVYMCL